MVRYYFIAITIIISVISISGAFVETTKNKQYTECIASFANSNRTIEDVQKACKQE